MNQSSWKKYAETLEARVKALEAENEALERRWDLRSYADYRKRRIGLKEPSRGADNAHRLVTTDPRDPREP